MKLKVLVDNNTYIDQYYCGEPAVSYYIEDEKCKILFDTGYSDLYLKNNNIKVLYPCHCTSLAVKAEMYKSLNIKEVGVGLELDW